MSWTPEEKQFLKDNFSSMTRAKLALEVSKKFGKHRTRNSVIGTITRMGLSNPGGQSQNARKERTPSNSKSKAKDATQPIAGCSENDASESKRLIRPITKHGGLPTMPFGREARSRSGWKQRLNNRSGSLASRRRAAMKLLRVSPREILLIELEKKDCRFATSHDGDRHRFCGAPQIDGFSYCVYHALSVISIDQHNIRIATKLINRAEELIEMEAQHV